MKYTDPNNTPGLNPYRVPEGFFQSFEIKVMQQAADTCGEMSQRHTFSEEMGIATGISVRHTLRGHMRWIAAAAVVAAIMVVAVVPLIKTSIPRPDAEIAFSNLTQTDQETILDSYGYLYLADDM